MSERKYIWQCDDWPKWCYDMSQLQAPLASVERQQQKLFASIAQIDTRQQQLLTLDAIADEVRQSSAIEGVNLDAQSVRSSVARRLGVDVGGLERFDRYVEGVVDMVMDATMRCNEPLTAERLYGWHAALFPTGFSGLYPVTVGRWRDDSLGAMQVVSGPIGRQTVHYEAPPASRVNEEMSRLLQWVNEPFDEQHPILRACIAHLWFVTIHPFDDGNGRVGRAIGDMMLARADGQSQRFYSFSAQALRDRDGYYKALECTQQDSMDVTAWAQWFVGALQKSVLQAQEKLDATLQRARCWQSWKDVPMNERQKKVLARMLEDDFRGYMKAHKWQNLTKCSEQQAIEDISHLVDAGILQAVPDSGKKTSYELVMSTLEAAEVTQSEPVREAMADSLVQPEQKPPPPSFPRMGM